MISGQVCLRRGETLAAGCCWIYDNEIDWADDTCEDGGLVEVLDSRMRYQGTGFFNRRSKITVRLVSRERGETIDRAFWERRIRAAWENRQALGFSNACRVIFGEPDGLPGLTVDKFGDCLSFQIVSLGMERMRDDILAILAEVFRPQCIYERDDLAVREKEGMEQRKGCVYGAVPPELIIREHDALMAVDIENGQKTGHFLDQQENRGHLRPYSAGRTVLDLCCHTGGFSIHAALYGAAHVQAVDVSETALAMVRGNAARNGVADRVETVCANVFDLVRQDCEEGRQFGLVICDPPAFAEGCDALDAAARLLTRLYALAEGKPCLLRFGKMESGSARNAVSDHTHLEGSLRCLDDGLYAALWEQAQAIGRAVGEETGCTVTMTCSSGYPPVTNDAALLAEVRERFPIAEAETTCITEDFSEYQRHAPGVFYFLGTGGIELHAPTFTFPEEILDKGEALLCGLV